jgi:hypothetical protein
VLARSAVLTLFLVVPPLVPLWLIRQPGHLLQRSVSIAPPPRGEFALFDHVQAL